MRKKSGISREDRDEFQHAMRGVKPLISKKIQLSSPKMLRTPHSKQPFADHSLATANTTPPDPVSGEEHIAFKQLGVQDKILRKLSKGQYTIDAILDLHGLSIAKAKIELNAFLQRCIAEEVRVALVIHGKGHHSGNPVLKNTINHWLRHIHDVLAFTSATPQHGRRGAVYVLLRHSEQERDR